ncbi:2TM domain-containing protein [Oricola sp.]|uniref:2TM domain-containing protein n=1 Tax=Oricola sp. TaxID=1979950 RepID=UPI0025F08278|nr:2TM domain-containing protein [Oricola sp.]MCI5074169.1 2TM domain-containing protein [Oricola sp.]
MQTDDLTIRARGRAEAKFGFYKHLAVYAVVCVLLLVINFLTEPGSYWVIWPVLGWGVAIIIHAVTVFGARRKEEIIDRMTDKEMGKRDWGRK